MGSAHRNDHGVGDPGVGRADKEANNKEANSERPPARHPMAVGVEWASRITAVALVMILPGIFGQWLDARWNTEFLGLGGLAFGNVAGIWYLLKMTKSGK